jgi:hypothetical protein
MDVIVQWATILSPIVAIVVAIWISKKSAKDTAKQVAAIEESTAKQIESIKKLSILQAEITSIQLDMEHWETIFRLHEVSGKTGEVFADNRITREELKKMDLEAMDEKEKARYLMLDFYDKQLNNLEGHIDRYYKIKEELGLY